MNAINQFHLDPAKAHEEMIDKLCADYPEVKRNGFWAAMKDLPNGEYVPGVLGDGYSWHFVPDAFTVDAEKRMVFIFEIVVSHDISDKKFAAFADFAYALDEDLYTLSVTRMDMAGARAYDPMLAFQVSAIERHLNGLPDAGGDIPNWKQYTYPACSKYVEASLTNGRGL